MVGKGGVQLHDKGDEKFTAFGQGTKHAAKVRGKRGGGTRDRENLRKPGVPFAESKKKRKR